MADPRRDALKTLYPTKSYGVALRAHLVAENDGSWRERDLFTGDGSYRDLAESYWDSTLVPDFAGPEDVVGAVAAWVADDASAAGDGNAVASWIDRVSSLDLAQATGTKQPLYRASGIGGEPALEFDGTDDLLRLAAADALSAASSGHVFAVILQDTSASDVVWSTADEAGTNRNLRGSFRSGATDSLLILQIADDLNDSLSDGGSNYDFELSTAYLVEWASTGSAYELRANGSQPLTLSVIAGANTGDWFGDTPGRDSFTLAAMKNSGGETTHFDGKIAMILVVDGPISADDRTALHAWVADKYGLTVA